MTRRLYYDDAFLGEFAAVVLRSEERGAQTLVWLAETAFYPTSGGQPCDVGTLGDSPVVDVHDDEDGDVVHVIAGAAPAVGTAVRGVIEWPRRFDHMQQHTGQHLLSAVVEHAFGVRTVSVHLGAASCTIDLERELTPQQLAAAEHDANAAIWSDVPVTSRYVSADEAKQLPLRKESTRSGTLRLVEIAGVDLSACGGTHVLRTGMIGQLVVSAWERFKGGQRVEFLCGQRALTRCQALRDISSTSTRLLAVTPAELPAAIERIQTELKEQRRALITAQQELAQYEGAALAAAAERVGDTRLVLRVVDADAVRLKTVATAAVAAAAAGADAHANAPLLVVLVSAATPALAVAARTINGAVSCHELISTLAKRFGGRGGGKPDLAQCGGLQAEPGTVLDVARSLVL